MSEIAIATLVARFSRKYVRLKLRYENKEIGRPWLSSQDVCMMAGCPSSRKTELLDKLRDLGMIRLDRGESPNRSRIWTLNITGTDKMEEYKEQALLCDKIVQHCGERKLLDAGDAIETRRELVVTQRTRNMAMELRERLMDKTTELYLQRQYGDLDNLDIGGPYDLWTETDLDEAIAEDDEYVERYLRRHRQ